jgi:hypothetical protein
MRNAVTAATREFRSPGSAFFLCLFFAVCFGCVAVTSILQDRFDLLAYASLAAVGLVVVLAILKNWRNGLYLFLGWLLFEDLVRKYLGNNMAIYFGKDLLAAMVYLSFYLAYRRKAMHTFRPPFFIPLFLFFWFAVIQVFNPAASSVAYGLLGLKLYFYYVPLLFVGYALVDSEKELRRFLFANLFVAAVIGGLGIAQAILGHTFLNPEHTGADIDTLSHLYRVAPISGVVLYRPNSVFVSDGRFSYYMILAWLLAFGVSGYLLLRLRRGRTAVSIALIAISGGVVLSGSRGAFLWTLGSALVCGAAFLWGAPWRQGEALRVVRTLQRTLLAIGIAFVLLLVLYPEAIQSRLAFYSETLSLDSPSSELVFRVRDYPLRNFLMAFDYPRWPYGYGTGTASLGIQYITRILGVPPMRIGVENGYGALVIEMGIVGLILWIIMSAAVVAAAWNVVRKLKGSPWFPLGFVIFWYAFLLLVPFTYMSMVNYQNFVLNAYFWVLLGILFRLPGIALSSQAPVAASAARPRGRWSR